MAGKVHSLLINFLFITAKRAVFIIKMSFFFYVDHFKLLAIKSMKKQKQQSPVFGMVHHCIATLFDHGFLVLRHDIEYISMLES